MLTVCCLKLLPPPEYVKWHLPCVFAGRWQLEACFPLLSLIPSATQDVCEWERSVCLWVFRAQHQRPAQPQWPAEEGCAVRRHCRGGGPAVPSPPLGAGCLQQLLPLENRRPGRCWAHHHTAWRGEGPQRWQSQTALTRLPGTSSSLPEEMSISGSLSAAALLWLVAILTCKVLPLDVHSCWTVEYVDTVPPIDYLT